MEFEELNNEEKLDYLDLLCWMSARANNLDYTLDVPERTEDEILENSSKNTLECWEEFLLSKLKKFDKMSDKKVIEMASGTSGMSMKQPLIEIHWLLVKWDTNTSKKEKYAKKVENWFKSHSNISLTSYPTETMKLLNKFDVVNNNILKGILR